MAQESCSNDFFRKIIAAWKKEWAHSVGLRGGMRPAAGITHQSCWVLSLTAATRAVCAVRRCGREPGVGREVLHWTESETRNPFRKMWTWDLSCLWSEWPKDKEAISPPSILFPLQTSSLSPSHRVSWALPRAFYKCLYFWKLLKAPDISLLCIKLSVWTSCHPWQKMISKLYDFTHIVKQKATMN